MLQMRSGSLAKVPPEQLGFILEHPGNIPDEMRQRILARDGHKCRACGAPGGTHRTGESLGVDHIRPRAAGGATIDSNLQTLCQSCNSKKSSRLVPEGPAFRLEPGAFRPHGWPDLRVLWRKARNLPPYPPRYPY